MSKKTDITVEYCTKAANTSNISCTFPVACIIINLWFEAELPRIGAQRVRLPETEGRELLLNGQYQQQQGKHQHYR